MPTRNGPAGGPRRAYPWESRTLTAYFRSLQRQFDLSVLLVHHTRKNAAGGAAAGQGLRGSSDIHAFGDSNLYLRRTKEHLVLSSEHRAAPASAPVYLELVATNAETTHLEVIAELQDGKRRSLEEQVLDLLTEGAVSTQGCKGVIGLGLPFSSINWRKKQIVPPLTGGASSKHSMNCARFVIEPPHNNESGPLSTRR